MIKKIKKAQLQMSETIFVVFIIMIIIVLGFVAYAKFQEANLQEKNKEKRNAKVIESAHRLSFWPELECSNVRVSEFACLDIAKLKVLGDFINASKKNNKYAFDYYFDLLRNSNITVKEVYPESITELGKTYWILWQNPGTKKTTEVVLVPVNLYDPFTGTYALGVMELQMYE